MQWQRRGGDLVVLTVTAAVRQDPPADRYPAYVAKYEQAIRRVSGRLDDFAAVHSVPIRIRLTGIRGF